jgi:hypothetical protein
VKILLDECVPRPLDQVLASHECVTPQDRGWGGITDGELLRRALFAKSKRLSNCIVEGEKRYSLHVAIDCFDGSIVGQT